LLRHPLVAVGGGRGQNLAAIYASRSAHLAQQIDMVANMVVQLGVAWETATLHGKGRLLFEHAKQHAPALSVSVHTCYMFVVNNNRLIEAAVQDMKPDLTGLQCSECKLGAGRSKREADMIDAVKNAAALHVDSPFSGSLRGVTPCPL
jgi:hypothetical protein